MANKRTRFVCDSPAAKVALLLSLVPASCSDEPWPQGAVGRCTTEGVVVCGGSHATGALLLHCSGGHWLIKTACSAKAGCITEIMDGKQVPKCAPEGAVLSTPKQCEAAKKDTCFVVHEITTTAGLLCIATPPTSAAPCKVESADPCIAGTGTCDGAAGCLVDGTKGLPCTASAEDTCRSTSGKCDGKRHCIGTPLVGKPCGSGLPKGQCWLSDHACDASAACTALPAAAGKACASLGSGGCGSGACDGKGACYSTPHPAGTPCKLQTTPVCRASEGKCDGGFHCETAKLPAGSWCPTAETTPTPCSDVSPTCTADGACVHAQKPVGSVCAEGNTPKSADVCIQAMGACNAKGICVHAKKPDGALCKDAKQAALPCVQAVGACETGWGCVHANSPVGTPCSAATQACMTPTGSCNGKGACISTTVALYAPCDCGMCTAAAKCGPLLTSEKAPKIAQSGAHRVVWLPATGDAIGCAGPDCGVAGCPSGMVPRRTRIVDPSGKWLASKWAVTDEGRVRIAAGGGWGVGDCKPGIVTPFVWSISPKGLLEKAQTWDKPFAAPPKGTKRTTEVLLQPNGVGQLLQEDHVDAAPERMKAYWSLMESVVATAFAATSGVGAAIGEPYPFYTLWPKHHYTLGPDMGGTTDGSIWMMHRKHALGGFGSPNTSSIVRLGGDGWTGPTLDLLGWPEFAGSYTDLVVDSAGAGAMVAAPDLGCDTRLYSPSNPFTVAATLQPKGVLAHTNGRYTLVGADYQTGKSVLRVSHFAATTTPESGPPFGPVLGALLWTTTFVIDHSQVKVRLAHGTNQGVLLDLYADKTPSAAHRLVWLDAQGALVRERTLQPPTPGHKASLVFAPHGGAAVVWRDADGKVLTLDWLAVDGTLACVPANAACPNCDAGEPCMAPTCLTGSCQYTVVADGKSCKQPGSGAAGTCSTPYGLCQRCVDADATGACSKSAGGAAQVCLPGQHQCCVP